jgi:hypothetical protein
MAGLPGAEGADSSIESTSIETGERRSAVTRSGPSAALVFALLAIAPGQACDYGSVDPSRFAPDAASGGDGTDGDGGDSGDDGSVPGDDGGDEPGDGAGPLDGGPTFQHAPFPIQDGTIHGAFECTDCHSDLSRPGDPEALVCTSCHIGSHDEGAMEDRHDVGPGVGALFEWSPPACVTCHPKADVYRRSEHNEDVLDDEHEHEDSACSACHPAQTDLTPSTFEGWKCDPCHDGIPPIDDLNGWVLGRFF